MKTTTHFIFDFTIEGDRIVGGYSPYMGHGTELILSGERQEDDQDGNLSQRLPVKDEPFILGIPSGSITGTVYMVERTINEAAEEILRVGVAGTWEGKFGGFEGGLSCYGHFNSLAEPDIEVESSWGTMPMAVYRAFRTLLYYGFEPERYAAVWAKATQPYVDAQAAVLARADELATAIKKAETSEPQ